MFEKFTELCAKSGREVHDVALGIDVRERGFFADVFANLDRLKSSGYLVTLLFLEASDVVLTRRFSESRRPHPFLPERPVLEGIRLERKYLHEIRERADYILDTSELTVHDLRDWMTRHFSTGDQKQGLKISLLTFGYKYGVPFDVDLVFDVRFLKNPNFVPTLKSFTGEHEEIQHFVLETHDAQVFLQHIRDFFVFLFPRYQRERRSHLTIAIGCTGGHHRSVAVGIQLKQICQELGYDVSIRHRDIQRSSS